MNTEQRMEIMRQRLEDVFHPTELEIIDDSHKHIGHVGARDGAGHYTLMIAAIIFQGKSRVTVHREIYQALGDLIPREVHALKIIIRDQS